MAMMEQWIIISLVIFSLELTPDAAYTCDEAYRSAATDYYTKPTKCPTNNCISGRITTNGENGTYIKNINNIHTAIHRLGPVSIYTNKHYTYNDMLYIAHGTKSNIKCNHISRYYNLHYHRACTGGICPISAQSRTGVSPLQCAREANAAECDPLYPYRSLDGHCNNLLYPDWGKAETLQTRLLPNAYDDGQGSPRTQGVYGPLPSARKISNIVHKAGPSLKTESKLSYMVMLLGQILAHDFVLSKMNTKSDGMPLQCCDEDKNATGCNSIQIPLDDPHFAKGGCMSFSRTNSMQDCNAIQQQFNSQTSYMDLSMLYGTAEKQSEGTRTFEGGKMNSVNNKLPVDFDDTTCQLNRPIDVPHLYCVHSGDPRVHENPALTSMHTILFREHNRLAEGLARVNPHWGDERLFQEARKINIAQWQSIIYQEYLPILVGPYWRRKYKLNIKSSGYKDTYSHHVDASITNAFAAAAFRFGHSMVHRHISMLGYAHENIIKPVALDDTFFEPSLYHANNTRGLEYMLIWTAATKCPMFDRELEKSVQTLLFKDDEQLSFDLAALNIHRGRDHGLPSYNEYRRMCGLSKVEHFGTSRGGLVDMDAHVADLIQQAYSHPEDIDLFTGLISERRGKWGILGPTGQCIVAIQFKRLRDGDRFFFERRYPRNPLIGFTAAQLNSIKKVRLSTLFCSNMEATRLQRNLLLQPTEQASRFVLNARRRGNVKVPCSVLRECQIDINLWRE